MYYTITNLDLVIDIASKLNITYSLSNKSA
jgi:hypothetical protein